MSNDTITLKRQATIRTIVTDDFRARAKNELSTEIKTVDNQLEQLEAQYQESLKQLESLASQGQNVKGPMNQMNQEMAAKRNQLTALKMEVSKQLGGLENVANGAFVVTGVLESFVDVKVGDNIYEKIQNCSIIIEDSVIKEIKG